MFGRMEKTVRNYTNIVFGLYNRLPDALNASRYD